ncbi:MAG: ComEA family DNA-binding protein, partial [Aminobacterium colombiense]|nr:ComEA family DNA-binding protein [Aminobacterium colombiense]
AGQKPASPSSGQNSDSSAGKKVNINRASEEELQALPGVGPSTAGSIVRYRESQGLFNGIEDLLRVRGIGPAKFEKIRHLVTVNQ